MFKKYIYIVAFIIFGLSHSVKAQVCSVSASGINFGTINTATGAAYTSSGSYVISCTGTPGLQIRVCSSFGSGTGGSGPGHPRYLLNGATQMNFNIYKNASFSNVWGSFTWPWSGSYSGERTTFTIPASGSIVTNLTMYGRVLPAQTTLPVGAYSSSFGGVHVRVTYDNLGALPCSVAPTNVTSVSFNVTAVNQATCAVSATDLNFGSTNVITSNVDATSTITAQCTNTIPYTISLDGGLSGAVSPIARKMVGAGGNVIYGMYKDAAMAQPWGNLIGTNTAAGVGTGINQAYTVYGRVAPQTTPAPGSYADTITVTITY